MASVSSEIQGIFHCRCVFTVICNWNFYVYTGKRSNLYQHREKLNFIHPCELESVEEPRYVPDDHQLIRLAFYRDWLLQEGIQETENVVEPRCQSPTFEGSCGINRVPWNPVTFPIFLDIQRMPDATIAKHPDRRQIKQARFIV